MRWTVPASSSSQSFEEVIARLATHTAVDGLLSIGSLSRSELTPSSDYDLLVLLREAPLPLQVALTSIDRRLADIIFVNVVELEHLLPEDKPVAGEGWARAMHLLGSQRCTREN